MWHIIFGPAIWFVGIPSLLVALGIWKLRQ